MSVRIMSEVFDRSKTQGNARLVLLSLADSCNDDASCWPSIRKIAEKANISEPITKKYLNALIQIGVITRDEREDFSGRQTSNLYTINIEKIGDDEITQDVIHQVTPPSRLKTFKGVTAVNVGEDNPSHMVVGVTKVSLPIMNHHKEPKIEPSMESSTMVSHSVLPKADVKSNDFDIFWNAYPKKVSKEQARKAWYKLKPDLSVIIPLIEKFKASKQWQDKQYIPNPDTFIRNKRWEDEIVVPSTTNQLLNVRSIPNGKVPVWQQIKDSGESEQAKEWLMENIPDLPSYELRAVEERHLIDYKNRLQSVEF